MTNMMNGAVAIYGGVGVMEIRQPLPQTVESMAQAVEGLAVNAHISLRELKNTVAAVIEKKLPKYAQLMEMHPVIAARTVVGGATLTAYENGYAVYEEDGAHTVMAIDRCGDYRYDFNDGTYEVVPAAVFEDAEWSVRLVMEGERRMEEELITPYRRVCEEIELFEIGLRSLRGRTQLVAHQLFVQRKAIPTVEDSSGKVLGRKTVEAERERALEKIAVVLEYKDRMRGGKQNGKTEYSGKPSAN